MAQRAHPGHKCYTPGMRRATLRNGTIILVRPSRTVIILPCGKIVRGEPQGTLEQAQTALDLGYGEDVGAMVTDHDPLHCIIADMLGLPTSYSLSGGDPELAAWEEAAVIATQRFMRRAGGRLPL